jgi:hypothetical protein
VVPFVVDGIARRQPVMVAVHSRPAVIEHNDYRGSITSGAGRLAPSGRRCGCAAHGDGVMAGV